MIVAHYSLWILKVTWTHEKGQFQKFCLSTFQKVMNSNKGRILNFTNSVLSYQKSFGSSVAGILDVDNFQLKWIDESSKLHWRTSLSHRMPWYWEVKTYLPTLLSGQYSAIAVDFCHYPLVFPNLLNLINPFLPCPL